MFEITLLLLIQALSLYFSAFQVSEKTLVVVVNYVEEAVPSLSLSLHTVQPTASMTDYCFDDRSG